MGQAAYDMTEVRRRRAPQAQPKVPLRVEKGGKKRLNPVRAAMQHALQLVGAALLVGFAVSLLWSEAQLVELNSQIQSAKAELVSEQSQYTYYNSALNSRTNITSVEETATRLGLMKIDQSQITEIYTLSLHDALPIWAAFWCARHPLCGSGRICSTMGQ